MRVLTGFLSFKTLLGRLGLLGLLLLLPVSPALADKTNNDYDCTPTTWSSTITVYNNSSGFAACHYADSTLPLGSGPANSAYSAVATHMYDDNLCGACAQITYNGTTAISMITDECPAPSNPTHCGAGSNHLDLSTMIFQQLTGATTGVFNVTWKVVPCPANYMGRGITGAANGSNLTYQFKSGASSGWATLIVKDYVMPISTLQYCTGLGTGCSAAAWQRAYNGWIPSGTWNTIYLRITGKTGEVKDFGPISCCSPQGTDARGDAADTVFDAFTNGNFVGCGAAASPTRTPVPGSPTITPTRTNSPTITPTPADCPVLLNNAETLTANGNWSGNNSTRSISTFTGMTGAGALRVQIDTPAAYNNQIANLDTFIPTNWSSFKRLTVDVYVDPAAMPWGGTSTYHQLSLRGTSSANAQYEVPFAVTAGADKALVSGFQTISFTIGAPGGTSMSAAGLTSIDKIFLVTNMNGQQVGRIFFDNLVLHTDAICPPFSPTSTVTRTNTPSPTRTNSPIASATSTATPTATPTRTATLTATRTNSPVASFTSTVTPTGTSTRSNTQSATPTSSPVNSSTSTATRTATVTLTPVPPSATPSITLTRTGTASSTATVTNTPSRTATPSSTPQPPTATPTATRTATASGTATGTATPTGTPLNTRTATPTYTISILTLTNTPTITLTGTRTNTALPTLTATPTGTPLNTRTATPTYTISILTLTNTPTITLTATRTNTALPTLTSTPTRTSVNTLTATPTHTTSIFTLTNTPTITLTSTRTNTALPTLTVTLTGTPLNTLTATPTYTTSIFTLTNTPTITLTGTPANTLTATPTYTTSIFTLTNTPTITRTDTALPTLTATPTVTLTGTSIATGTATLTGTAMATGTATSTGTAVATATPTVTLTATATVTATITPTIALAPVLISLSPGTQAVGVAFTLDLVGSGFDSTAILVVNGVYASGGVPIWPLSVGGFGTLANTPLAGMAAGTYSIQVRNGGSGLISNPLSLKIDALTPTPTVTAEDGELAIIEAKAYPNPISGGNGKIGVNLRGRADKVTVKVYTKALVCVGRTDSSEQGMGAVGPGWINMDLPQDFVKHASSGSYYFEVSASRGVATTSKNPVGKIMVLR